MKIIQPELIVDKEKCIANIKAMYNKAKQNNLIFRPHFKTHQSAEIGNWFKDFGIDKITVSSLDMALYFAENGWNDITVAFPVNILEIGKINFLAERIKLNLLVESLEVVEFLEKSLNHKINIFIKVDVGYGRTGIAYYQLEHFEKLSILISNSKYMQLAGLLTHAGHTYKAQSKEDILKIKDESVERLLNIKTHLNKDIMLSYGDTPSCSIAENFHGIDEIRPGNFVFYDLMQYQLGICTFNQIACTVACPVVSKPAQDRMVIYGGAVHLSKDRVRNNCGTEIFGQVVKLNDNLTWNKQLENLSIISLSQEHGIIMIDEHTSTDINIGDVIGVIPIHSCLSANLFNHYYLTNGEKIKRI
ncbi:MAG: alanine racemase [Melioribacteraceae bacterium]|nr:alanine racemase [Melioribacteraceae bacterium]